MTETPDTTPPTPASSGETPPLTPFVTPAAMPTPEPTAPTSQTSQTSQTAQTEPVPGLPFAATWAAPAVDVAASDVPAKSEKRSRKAVAFALAAGLLVGAAGTGAVLVATDAGDTPKASSTTLTQSSTNPAAPVRAEGTVASVAAAVLPSVVSIQGQGGEGSGIILDTQGHILTNNHVAVLGQNGGSLTVVLQDGRSANATIVGTDPTTDLAVLKVDGLDNITPIKLGSSADLAVGDQVLAVGSPLGLSGTVTEGIVSALNRPVSAGESGSEAAVFEAIQTDAAINPGNSGGALVDSSGQLVGVNSAIASLGAGQGQQSGSIGLGFAIPVDQATRIAQELIDSGTASHARLGTTVGDAQTGTGAVLGDVTAGSAADKAGLKSGDVVTKIDGRVIDGAEGLIAAIRSEAPGDQVTLTYLRNGKEATATVTLGSDVSTT